MRYRYGVDKINWRNFRDWLDQASASARMRYVILVWLVGLVYLLIGAFFWHEWMAQFNFKMQALWMLVMFVTGPALLAFAASFSRLFGDWPLCPACGKKIHVRLPTLASKRCPHCYARILEDTRELSPGYILPLTLEESQKKKSGYDAPIMDTASLRVLRIIVVMPPLMIALFLAFGLNRDMELAPMMEAIVVTMGVAIIGMVGIPPLISISWMMRVCRFLRIIPKDQFIYCPECGSIPSAYIARKTGCCSECGAKLLELANEPDTPDMLDWLTVKRYQRWKSRTAIIAAVLIYPVCLPAIKLKCWWLLWVVGAIVAIVFVQDFRLKKLARIPKKCPHCAHPLGNPMWSLIHYGRCSHCNRKLVRDGDAEKVARK